MPTITPFLWFDGHVGEAVDFYTSVFGDSSVEASMPGPDGEVMMATLSLAGQQIMLLNGGPHHALTPAFSLFVSVDGQGEVDRYWEALGAGGEFSQCGWLVDRFGVSWQVVPTTLGQLIGSPDHERAGRAMAAMMGMTKIDIAGLQAAYDG